MTRQHFQALADLIGEHSAEQRLNHKQEADLTDRMIFLCRQSNSAFQVERFCDAIEKAKEKTINLLTQS